ncbi:MAG: response regulator [Saccharofermentans sp.]|nr:response regulator [Saccharofermentans sp.]
MYDVLIVEDDPMVAMINKQYIAQNDGFNIVGMRRDGQTAIEYIQTNHVDLIILDQYMPKVNGIDVLRYIRQNEYPISVIMVTAANDSQTVEEALRLGIVDYLVKPFSAQRFAQALNTFINRQKTLSPDTTLNQKNIDELIGINTSGPIDGLPKGIQENTLKTIEQFLKKNAFTKEMTSEEIADGIGISRVTIRRYMNYLIEAGLITGRMNYETGGRPSMMYIWNSLEE